MPRQRKSRTTLAWQAGIILLPVLVLAGIGAFYLRQDRILVRHEAEERARALVEEIAPKLWDVLISPAGLDHQRGFQVDASGALLFPPPVEVAPTPRPLPIDELSPEMAELWRRISDPAARPDLDDCARFEAPPQFEALLRFRQAEALAARGNFSEAVGLLRSLWEQTNAVGETGLPLAPLAAVKIAELTGSASDWEAVCAEAVQRPTVISPLLLRRAIESGAAPEQRVAVWRGAWEVHEKLRALHRSARASFGDFPRTPRLFWADTPSGSALLTRVSDPDGKQWFVHREVRPDLLQTLELDDSQQKRAAPTDPARTDFKRADAAISFDPAANAMPRLRELLSRAGGWPGYFELTVEVAGRFITRPGAGIVLARAARGEDGHELLNVAVHLAHPQKLYAGQQQRVIWFGLLIAVSSAAALLAAISLWRSFERQQRLAEAKDNFVSSVSHELRAPIASVRLMAEGLERGRVTEPEKQREYFGFIVRECQRLSALIQNVLDFSRIDQGRKQYEFELTDVGRLAEETVRNMQPYAVERQVQLRLKRSAAGSLQACMDGRAMQQALINLIDNAIKHSPAGSEVEIGFASDTGMLALWVKDNGEGIAASEHAKIFERFYRVGSELTRQTPGAGIGLSIVKHIVEAHGGCVRVESAPGKGSRFTLELPLKQ